MALVMIAFWSLVTVLVVYVVRNLSRDRSRETPDSPSGALRILDERFARGDIDADEYRQRREQLTRT